MQQLLYAVLASGPGPLVSFSSAQYMPCTVAAHNRHFVWKLLCVQKGVFRSTSRGSVGMQIRAFASNPHSTSKQELNQSPLAFIESASEPGLEEALKRKDNIIRVRNAQISALWDELHTRQPWKNAIKGEEIVAFPEDAANTTRKLAVLGINTVSAAHVF